MTGGKHLDTLYIHKSTLSYCVMVLLLYKYFASLCVIGPAGLKS